MWLSAILAVTAKKSSEAVVPEGSLSVTGGGNRWRERPSSVRTSYSRSMITVAAPCLVPSEPPCHGQAPDCFTRKLASHR